MLFNSHVYIFLFLPIVTIIYFTLFKKNVNSAVIFLVLASLFFYAYWNPKFLPIILLSIFFNYFVGGLLLKSKSKRTLIWGIILNLLPLIFFKYSNFIIHNINMFFSQDIARIKVTLPLAISFFTFQQIAYLVDSYKGVTKEHNFASYSLFVSFFPQLVAGPIVHHKQMIPQFYLKNNSRVNYRNINKGITIFVFGLMKKIVIADSFTTFVANGFDLQYKQLDFFESWISTFCYTFQLYFDFSGYCDMAIGSALLFNIFIPENFNSPYKSKNIQEFWQRWHMTLGNWLRDYVYIPLGGNRCSRSKEYVNLFITFIVGGIWHGAGWNFLIWGLLHGLGLIFIKMFKFTKVRLPSILACIITFFYVHFTWVFFRAPSFTRAKHIIFSMLGLNEIKTPNDWTSILKIGKDRPPSHWLDNVSNGESPLFIIGLILAAAFISFLLPNTNQINKFLEGKRYTPFLIALLLSITLLFITRRSEFLYFQF